MKKVNLLIAAGFSLFLVTGIAGAADLEDIDVTIRVMEPDDDLNEVENELHLPDSAADTAREHAEDSADDHDGQEVENESNDDMNEVEREDQEDVHEDGMDTHEEGVEDSTDSADETPDSSSDGS